MARPAVVDVLAWEAGLATCARPTGSHDWGSEEKGMNASDSSSADDSAAIDLRRGRRGAIKGGIQVKPRAKVHHGKPVAWVSISKELFDDEEMRQLYLERVTREIEDLRGEPHEISWVLPVDKSSEA